MINFFRKRNKAYREVFDLNSDNVCAVLADLKKFCRHNASTFSEDSNRQSYLNGRRDVLERILQNINISDEQISKIEESLT